MKASSKKDINFLESQKIGSKETKSNFELILIVAAVLGIGVLGYFYWSISSQIKTLEASKVTISNSIVTGNETLDNLKAEIANYDTMIANLNAQIAAYNSADAQAGSDNNLTEAHIKAVYMESYYAGMEVSSMSLSGNTLTFTVTTTDYFSIVPFNESLKSSEVSQTGYTNSELFIFSDTNWQMTVDQNVYTINYSLTILPVNITEAV